MSRGLLAHAGGALAVTALVVRQVPAQDPAGAPTPPRPQFEVSSIKPNTGGYGPGHPMVGPHVENDRFIATNVPVFTLIQAAYGVDASHLVGAPAWVGKPGPPSGDLFDVIAKADRPIPERSQWQSMLQALLEDRFNLAVHREKREEAVWEIIIASRDRKLGPSIHPALKDCAALRAKATRVDVETCGDFSRFGITGVLNGRGQKLDLLAGILMFEAERRVVNKTGLDGVFDWDLKFTPRAFIQRPVDRERFPLIDPEGPGIFTALEEQLGLKLQSGRDQGDFVVID